jgi:hypothetical protein
MNLTDYDFTLVPGQNPPWHMDDRHVRCLYEMARRCTGNIVEVGCYRGRSTSALIEASNDGAPFHLTLIEPQVTPELQMVISRLRARDRLRHFPSVQQAKLPEAADLWIIDGDQGWPALLDVLAALCTGARVIVMHDSQAYPSGLRDCFGAHYAAELLKRDTSRDFIEDAKPRPGERTERGLLISTSNSMELEAIESLISPCLASA